MSTTHGDHERCYKYDLNGNLISGLGSDLEYTADNQVKLLYVQDEKWSKFDYAPGGNRFRQFARNGPKTEETFYVGLFEKVISYSAPANSVAPYSIKFNGFGKFTRSRNYIANSSGIFAVDADRRHIGQSAATRNRFNTRGLVHTCRPAGLDLANNRSRRQRTRTVLV